MDKYREKATGHTNYTRTIGLEFLKNITREGEELYLVHCGHQKCPPNYTYNHSKKDNYHLHFILGGRGRLIVEGQEYCLKKDDIFVLDMKKNVHYFADEEDPWEYIWVAFNGKLAEKYLSYAGLSKQTPTIHSRVPCKNYRPYIEEMLILHRLNRSNEIRRIGLLYELLADLIQFQNPEKQKYDYSKGEYLSYALSFIKKNYKEVTVKDVANYVGINTRYLAGIFKEELNISPKQYIIDMRMKQAESLLMTSNMKINEIAGKVGYKDAMTFSRMFKKYFGKSPKNYREKKFS